MGAEDHFADIISEQAAFRISFALGGLSITGSGLARVAQALRQRRIQVYRHRGLPAGVDAQYNVGRNALLVREYRRALFSSISSRAVTVHECVHALIDLNRATATTALSGEAAGLPGTGLVPGESGRPPSPMGAGESDDSHRPDLL